MGSPSLWIHIKANSNIFYFRLSILTACQNYNYYHAGRETFYFILEEFKRICSFPKLFWKKDIAKQSCLTYKKPWTNEWSLTGWVSEWISESVTESRKSHFPAEFTAPPLGGDVQVEMAETSWPSKWGPKTGAFEPRVLLCLYFEWPMAEWMAYNNVFP